MQLETHPWEGTLLSLAREARHSTPLGTSHRIDSQLLERAYAYCESVTAINSRSFHLASGLLPDGKRQAARALYAFCRVSDDIVDEGGAESKQELTAWRAKTSLAHPPEEDLVAVAWADARLRYDIPLRYAEQLLDGVATDLEKDRFATIDELAQYSYGVASTVGLMSMHIIGYSDEEALPYAIKLGVALQLTNILRDISEDRARGRVYVPQDELAHFGLSEDDIAAGVVTDAWCSFMRFQIERNRRLYSEAMPGIGYLDSSGRFAIGAAAELYRAILDDIERHDYDVFARRAYVSKWGKIGRLPGIWWRSRNAIA